jgi:hypothetical protein
MELVPLRNKKVTLAVGLDRWTSLNPLDSSDSQINGWKGDGLEFAATYRAGQSAVYGLVQGVALSSKKEQTKGTRVLALAACVALHKPLRGQNAFVAFKLQDDLLAVIGLRTGVVVLDALVSTYSLEEARKKFEGELGGQAYEVWGDTNDLPESARGLELDAVVPSRGGPQVAPLRSSRGALIALPIFAGVALIGAGVYAYLAWQQQSALDLQRKLLVRDGAQAQYRRAIDQLLAKPVVPLSVALQTFQAALSSVPIYHAGWELHGATCASTGMCTLKYQRIAGVGTTFNDFAAKPEPGWEGVAPTGEEEAVVSMSVKVPTSLLDRKSWPTAEEFTRRNQSQWQFLEPGSWKATLGARAIQSIPAGIEPKDLPGLSTMPEAVFALPVSIAAQQWWYVDDDPDSPTQLDFIGSNTVMDGDLEIAVSPKDVTFSVKGLSYVR